jgi:hypothetical protein
MEYMIARSWVDEILEAADQDSATGRLLQQSVESLGSFPPALGSVLFLDKMLDRGGRLINDFIKRASKINDFFLNSQQTSLVYAFESINFATADDELIQAVEKFESTVREELRDRLASVILKILEARPDHPYARKYVHQVLEVGDKDALISAKRAESETSSSSGSAGKSELETVRTKRAPSRRSREEAKSLRTLLGSTPKQKDEIPRLPPGRYHYSEETKINAIGILVQMKDNNDYKTIEEGIRRLGRSDLHSALQALEHLDLAKNEMVYKTVASYMRVNQPEYRIYCAWLLRERYGREPANYIRQLLTDRESRVHHYAKGLFERRLIERELIEEMLEQIRTKGVELKPWHLSHFIKLLKRRASFRPQALVESYGSGIVNALATLLNHRQTSIRLEVYRAIAEFPSFIALDVVRQGMKQDSDIYIRSLADKLIPDT